MAVKAAQTSHKTPSLIPVSFDEDLATRCFPNRFRRVGDPYGYLDEVGLEPILEYIYKGNLLIDVASATNVPLMRLRRWVEDRNFTSQIDDAETQSADGYLSQARTAIKNAPTEFELRRAKEMMNHAKFMAENKNKQTYGGGVAKQQRAPVTYQFVIGTPTPEAAQAVQHIASSIIEGESKVVEPVPMVSLAHMFPGLNQPDVVQEPVLVARRPPMPTPTNPDVGPFYDDPTDVENTELPDHYRETRDV